MIPRLCAEAVIKKSRAEDAGILPGDIVIGYGDHAAPTFKQFLEINTRAAGKETNITVLRNGEPVTLKIVPKRRSENRAEVGIFQGADLMHAIVADLREGSPTANAGLAGGDEIEKINSRQVNTWIDVFHALKGLEGKDVSITFRRGAHERTVALGPLDSSIFDATDYNVSIFSLTPFKPLEVRIVKRNPIKAIAWGAGETRNFIVSTYLSLRSLIKGTVSTETLSGPLGIGRLGVQVVRERPLIDFVYLLAFISATLAVINFLPLPVVDGGHAVFLLIEKIRGRPLPVKIMNAVQFAGLVLLGLAFVLLTWQDFARWWETLW
jgi:regulator of sigma E protease